LFPTIQERLPRYSGEASYWISREVALFW